MENKLPITVAENVYLGSTEEETGMPLSDVLEGVVVAVEEIITDYNPNTLQPTLTIGTVTTVSPTTPASVVNSGTDHDVILDFDLPKGETGNPGTAATITVGTVTTGAPETAASVTNVGTAQAAIFNFIIPKGNIGVGIASLARTSGTGAAGTTDTYTITFTDSSTVTYNVYNGADGANGRGIVSVARTAGTGAAGTTDTYTITFTASTTTTYDVYNGANGTGIGDMVVSIYDPAGGAEQVAFASELAAIESITDIALVFIGTLATFESLPAVDQKVGDMYYITADAVHYFWNGTAWAIVGGGSGVASDIGFTPTGGIVATNVQTAIAELDTEKAPLASPTFTGTVGGITAAMVGALPLSGGTLTGTLIFGNGTSPNTNTIQFGDNTGWNLRFMTRVSGTPTTRFTFADNGNFTAVGNVTAYSDERLKSNISTITNALEKVKAIRGVEFDKDGKHSIGVIAQEVQKIIPEVVLEGEYLSVAYGNMVGLLIEAIKEQQKQIDELKAEVAKYGTTD